MKPMDAFEAATSRLTADTGIALPDVATDTMSKISGTLDRVGMSGISVMMHYPAEPMPVLIPAMADAYVNITNPETKGIHMSRLFLALQEILPEKPFSMALCEEVLGAFIRSHRDLSDSGFLNLRFEHPRTSESLLSGLTAWRSYPVQVRVSRRKDRVVHRATLRVTYSSACPCSAALSRQVIQQQFMQRYGGQPTVTAVEVLDWLGDEDTVIPVPHSQRSHADITVEYTARAEGYHLDELIQQVEAALTTPVQAAVKRADEQEFARLNGLNLMFCEDAARKIKQSLDAHTDLHDFLIKVSHLESLHAHDAVAMVAKGIPGGFTAA